MHPHEEAKRIVPVVAKELSKYWKNIQALVSPLRKGTMESMFEDLGELGEPSEHVLERKMTI